MDPTRKGLSDLDRLRLEVERLLHSEALRTSAISRRLLEFLLEKSLSGDADQLKEYTVAVDGLQKPPTYDPRHDNAVRVQMGTLRRKLADYYLTEGKDSEVTIDLPRGRFKLTCVPRVSVVVDKPSKAKVAAKWASALGLIWLGILIATASGWRLGSMQTSHANGAAWNQDMEDLWRPFLRTNRPFIIAVGDPLFVTFGSVGLVIHDPRLKAWSEVETSPSMLKIKGVLADTNAKPNHHFTTYGEANIAFVLGKLLGAQSSNITLTRTSDLSEQQLSDSNVMFMGNEGIFQGLLKGLPIQAQLTLGPHGVIDSMPEPGGPDEYLNHSASGADGEGEGAVFSLVNKLPGPQGRGEVLVFSSAVASGYQAGVQWFTEPTLAHDLVVRLRKKNGQMPRYYQVLLQVKYKDEVPQQSSVILTRELH